MRTQTLYVFGRLVDIFNRLIFPIALFVVVGKMDSIAEQANVPSIYLLSEFLDACFPSKVRCRCITNLHRGR